jgi:hypothetical protein
MDACLQFTGHSCAHPMRIKGIKHTVPVQNVSHSDNEILSCPNPWTLPVSLNSSKLCYYSSVQSDVVFVGDLCMCVCVVCFLCVCSWGVPWVPTSLRKCSPAPSPPRSSLTYCKYTVLRIPNTQYENQVGDMIVSTRDQAQRSDTFQLFPSACTHANHGRVAYEFFLKNAQLPASYLCFFVWHLGPCSTPQLEGG